MIDFEFSASKNAFTDAYTHCKSSIFGEEKNSSFTPHTVPFSLLYKNRSLPMIFSGSVPAASAISLANPSFISAPPMSGSISSCGSSEPSLSCAFFICTARLGITHRSLSILTSLTCAPFPVSTITRPAMESGLSSHDSSAIPPYFSILSLV